MKKVSGLREQLNRLGEPCTPLFGQLSLWILLCCCIYLVAYIDIGYVDYEKGNTVSVFGFIAPDALLSDEAVFALFKVAFFAAAACWCFRIWTPVSCWFTLILYTIVVSIYWENLPWFRHKYVLPNWLLFVYALWFHFYGPTIKTALQRRVFWQTRCYPYWIFLLSVYCVVVFYSMSGWSKILASGLTWGDGMSLQIWTWWNGDENSLVTQWIVSDHRIAFMLQSGALFLECFAFLAIFSRHCRVLICIGLILFHIAVDVAFGIDFRTNIVLVATFLLPFFQLCRSIDTSRFSLLRAVSCLQGIGHAIRRWNWQPSAGR